MTSGVKTSPRRRYSWSDSRASRTSGRLPGVLWIFGPPDEPLCSSISYRSTSTGSGGSILLITPSRPAINIAEKARYGLHDGSGARNSSRLALGLLEYVGMRMHAERLRCEYTRLIGAS